MVHPRPPTGAGERETLTAFLDYYRAVVAEKASGLDGEQLSRRLPPSELTLGGIVHHLAWVENWWFNEVLMDGEPGEPWASARWDEDRDWEFHAASTLTPAVIVERYRGECERSRRITAAASLDEVSRKFLPDGRTYSLRWILVHMIEETARHAGHADLIRESIDGTRGD